MRFILTLLALTFAPIAAQPHNQLTPLFKKVAPFVVQVIGAGGIKNVPSRGAGIIISKTGHILTFDTIALRPDLTKVALTDGTIHPAKILTRDPERNLALLKIKIHKPLPVVTLPPIGTKPGPGQLILLVGFPFKVAGPRELPGAFFGMIQARLRLDLRLRRSSFTLPHEVLLTDAPNNPGSQGGGLFDLKGNLIGIVGRVLESTETNTLVSYSLPIDVIRPLLKLARDGGSKVTPKIPTKATAPPVLGIKLFDYGLRSSPPAYIQRVTPGSPAAKAGLRPDDLILEMAGKPVRTCKEFRLVLRRLPGGKDIHLIYQRQSKVHQTKLVTTREAKK